MRTLWVDLLCFKSIIIAMFGRGRSVDIIRYTNISISLKPFVKFIEKVLNKPIVQINCIILTEQNIDGINLYEIIQDRIRFIINKWSDSDYVKNNIINFTSKTKLDPIRYSEHIKQSAYSLAYKPIEIYSISESFKTNHRDLFLFKKNILSSEIKDYIGHSQVDFFSYVGIYVEKRSDYYFDEYVNNRYYQSNFTSCKALLFKWFLASFLGMFSKTNSMPMTRKNIGVELLQEKVKLDYINDIYWLNNSEIDDVIAFSRNSYDSESIKNLDKSNVKVFITSDDTISYLRNIIKIDRSRDNYRFITVDKNYFLSTVVMALRLPLSMFLNNTFGWFNFQECNYYIRSKFWSSIYKKLGISLFWTMLDIDPDKLVKSQALDLCKGLYIGSHWSNYPIWQLDTKKCYDVFFVWSKHFLSDGLYPHYNYKATFQVGYPADYYFSSIKEISATIRNKHENKFILSYFDNTLSNDLPFSHKMQSDIYEMLISLLKDFDNLVIFFKPKRILDFNDNLYRHPLIEDLIKNNRIKVFFGETNRIKARPAEIAMASDLVVGIGISTAAAEASFAGVVSFHANLSGFNNAFDKNAFNKVVFRDVKYLKLSIIDQITGNGISVNKCKEYHTQLDPFQDGQAYKRTGRIICRLQEHMRMGLSRTESLNKVNAEFSMFLCAKSGENLTNTGVTELIS